MTSKAVRMSKSGVEITGVQPEEKMNFLLDLVDLVNSGNLMSKLVAGNLSPDSELHNYLQEDTKEKRSEAEVNSGQ